MTYEELQDKLEKIFQEHPGKYCCNWCGKGYDIPIAWLGNCSNECYQARKEMLKTLP